METVIYIPITYLLAYKNDTLLDGFVGNNVGSDVK